MTPSDHIALPQQLRKTVHPHRFMMWLSMASIVMLFAGFTSAYIVKHADTNVWESVELPSLFWVSTTLILASSISIFFAVRAFHRNNVKAYRNLLALTFVLGFGFLLSQWMAWQEMLVISQLGIGDKVAADFLYVISGAHFLHAAGGVVAMGFLFFLALRHYRTPEDALMLNLHPEKVPGIELVATYWHFVDALWLYLFIFFIANT
ncbi:MAG: heme-copper oxidase subunit III [Bacteroidetes bacterium]|nr:heme-copper oxidase subunit III [Bacteroidota bacterium]